MKPERAAKTRKKGRSQKAVWRKSLPAAGPIGSVYLDPISPDQNRLLLDFEYSEERVAALKSLGGARFDPARKLWTLPLPLLPKLQSRELFSDKFIRYYVDEQDLALPAAERNLRRERALAQLSENPFRVDRASLALSPVDLELHLNPDRRLLILRPRFRSKVGRLLSREKGLLRSVREGGYLLQAHALNDLLRRIRDAKFSFAVEESAGELLAQSATLRAKLLEQDGGSAEELFEALLTPILRVHPEEESFLRLESWSPEHLQLLFPLLESFPERKRQAESIAHDIVPQIFQNAASSGLRIWQERQLAKFFRNVLPRAEQQIQEERRALFNRARWFEGLSDLPLDPALLSRPEMAEQLFAHQRVAVNWLREMPRAFLGDDMGLGKTLSVLTYFDSLAAEERADFLFVVCPNSLKRNWVREAEQWFPRRKLLLPPESKKERRAFFRHLRYGARLCSGAVFNFESIRMPDVLEEARELLSERVAVLCVDESQRVKNPKSKSFKSLAELAPLCSRRVLLSGTPVPRDFTDIWSQIFLLDDGERFGKNFYRWLSKIAELGNAYSEFAVKRFRKEELEEAIGRAQELLLRRRKEDVLSLPEKTFSVRDIELGGDQRKFYNEVRKELLLRVTSLSGGTFLREIQSVLEEYLRAVQVASNPRLVDAQWKGDPAKFVECDEIVREVVQERGGKLVIWTNYLLNVGELVARYQEYGARAYTGEVSTGDRDQIVKEFQSGETVRILVAIPAAGGVGITLTAAQTAVYLEKTWNAEHYLQSVDRLHRIGQTGTVSIISLHASKVDDLIASNLRKKEYRLKTVLGDDIRMDELPEELTVDDLVEALRE